MKEKISIFISIMILIGLLTITQGCNQTKKPLNQNSNMETTANLTAAEMQKIIGDSVDWFEEAQLSNGRFNYEYAPFWNRYTDDDNIVRQTGALYYLGEVLSRDTSGKYAEKIKEMMRASINYFETKTVDGEHQGKKFKCILKTDSQCSLGAVGLALVGILDLVQKYPELEKEYSALMTGYLDYLIAMKLENKGFIDAYYVDGFQSKSESSFSNGEAFLALVRYNKYKPDAKIKKMIDDVYPYFEEIYGADYDNNFYLWGMAAIKDLYAVDPKDKYFQFVKKYTDERIKPYKLKRETSHNVGAYLEGIVSAYSVLEERLTETEKQAYLEEINFWLTKISKLQVHATSKYTTSYEDDTNTHRLKVKDRERAVGGFLTGLDEPFQRIDFTQHCGSAYLQKLVDIDGKTL